MKIRLVTKLDNETGELGLMVDGTPIISYPMVASEPLIVAHDLLEHVNGVENIGSIDDELEALGGIWFVRGQHGELRRDHMGSMHSVTENIASDVLNMARIYNGGVKFKTKVPSTRAHDHDDNFLDIINIAKEQVKDEMDNDERDNERLEYYFNACLHYMRVGYRKAQKRFGEGYKANNLFWEIVAALQPTFNIGFEFEGQEFELFFTLNGTQQAYCEEYYEDEMYY